MAALKESCHPAVLCWCLQSAAALAGALAQRNKQLQEAKASVEQLQQQLAQQQEAAAKQLEAAAVAHDAEKVQLEQDKQEHMRDSLQLEVGGGGG
jgi:ABC-type transporter Mla subunit MlaD